MDEKKIGVIISYLTLLVSSLLSILLTPVMLKNLGDVEYGLYQTITSFIGVLTVLDFGSGVATTRYVAKYNLQQDKEGCNNYLAMSMIINVIISVLIFLIGSGFVLSIDNIYSKSFSGDDVEKAKILAVLYIINISVNIFLNMFYGVAIGYKKFLFGNGTQLIKIVVRFGLIYILLAVGMRAIAISIADIAVNIGTIIFVWGYIKIKLDVRLRLVKWDKVVFWETFSFSVALFLQSIVNQVNNSIDKVILGSMIGGTAVTIYSVAMSIYLIYGSLSGAVKKVLLPDAVELVKNGVDGKKVTEFVIKGGRFQFMVLIYILCGFFLVGREFITLWVGEHYQISYYIAIILMVPTLFQLSQNITETILDAMGKRMLRSVILFVGAMGNIFLTILLIKLWGLIGAPIATAITCVLSWLIALNIYHHKVMKLQVIRMFIEICRGTFLCAVVSTLLCGMLNYIEMPNALSLLVKGMTFTVIYIIMLWRKGFNKEEQQMLRKVIPFLKLEGKNE